MAALLCLFPLAPAVVEPEPDDVLREAIGPILASPMTGTLASLDDRDWFMFYAAAVRRCPRACKWATSG